MQQKNEAPLCACGCKERVKWNKIYKKWEEYLYNHRKRTKKFWIIPKGNPPLCICGCNEKVNWNKSLKKWNKYLHNHHGGGKSCLGLSERLKGKGNPNYGKGKIIKEKRGEPPFCACECEKKVKWNNSGWKWNKYIYGHKVQKIDKSNWIRIPCYICKKDVYRLKSEIIRRKTKYFYCSTKCCGIARTQQNTIKVFCSWCNKSKNLLKKRLKLNCKNYFCNAKCRGKYQKGRKHSEETKKKIAKNHANFSGKNHPNYGKQGIENPKWKGGVGNYSNLQKFSKKWNCTIEQARKRCRKLFDNNIVQTVKEIEQCKTLTSM